jgi:predicted ATPase
MNRMTFFYRPRNSDILAYMHYIGDSYPASFDVICREHVYSKIFSFFPWEEIYVSDEALWKLRASKLIQNHLIETYEDMATGSLKCRKIL